MSRLPCRLIVGLSSATCCAVGRLVEQNLARADGRLERRRRLLRPDDLLRRGVWQDAPRRARRHRPIIRQLRRDGPLRVDGCECLGSLAGFSDGKRKARRAVQSGASWKCRSAPPCQTQNPPPVPHGQPSCIHPHTQCKGMPTFGNVGELYPRFSRLPGTPPKALLTFTVRCGMKVEPSAGMCNSTFDGMGLGLAGPGGSLSRAIHRVPRRNASDGFRSATPGGGSNLRPLRGCVRLSGWSVTSEHISLRAGARRPAGRAAPPRRRARPPARSRPCRRPRAARRPRRRRRLPCRA